MRAAAAPPLATCALECTLSLWLDAADKGMDGRPVRSTLTAPAVGHCQSAHAETGGRAAKVKVRGLQAGGLTKAGPC